MEVRAARDVRFGPFYVAVSDRLLYRDGELIHVPPKVFDTLLVLVANAGHVVAKSAMIEQLWPDTFVEEGTLTQYVSVLRKALGEYARWIENHPRRGYRFIGPVEEARGGGATELRAEASPGQALPVSLGAEIRRYRALISLAAIAAMTATALALMTAKNGVRDDRPSASRVPLAKSGEPRKATTGPPAVVMRARSLLASNFTPPDLVGAASALDQALKADPDLADAYALLAHTQVALYHNGWAGTDFFRAAISNANQALAREPESAAAMRALVSIQHSAGREVEGLAMALRVLEKNPQGVDSQAAAADAYFRTGLYERAIPLFEQALDEEPENRHFRSQLARMHLFLGNYDKGIEAVSGMLPSQVGPFGLLLYAETGRMDKALEIARTDPERGSYGIFGYFRGCVLSAAGDLTGARRIWAQGALKGERMLEENENPFVHQSVARLYAALGQREKALRHNRMALQHDPRHPVFLFFAAEVDGLLGNREAALDDLEGAMNNGFFNLPMIAYHARPMMSLHNLRNEPRFHSILARMNARVEELRSRYATSE